MPFQLGNPGPPKQEKLFAKTLQRSIAQDDAKRIRACVEKLMDLAAAGEPWAVQMLADRLDGKPAQAITGADGGTLIVKLQSSDADL